MLEIYLTWPELRRASYAGVDRFVRALSQGRQPSHGVSYNSMEVDILGTWGEAALAKATGSYWIGDLGHPDAGAPDVGPFHVRTTFVPNGHLILHDTDEDDEPYVLVIVRRVPSFFIAGWCIGRDGKRDMFWQDPTNGRPAYFVPQSALHPITEFVDDPGVRDESIDADVVASATKCRVSG